MAKIGDIYIGGSEGNNDGRIFLSGISFYQKSISKISRTLKFEDGKWEVEIKEGYSSIVARCIDKLNEDAIIKSGFKFIQMAIDIISVANDEDIAILEPGKHYYLLHLDKELFHFKQVYSFPIIYEMTVNIEIRDKDGNIKPQPIPLEPKTSQALRYYRLSQNSPDLYEAYKNLFLSFEYALTDMFPRKMTAKGKPERWDERNRYKSALI